MIDITNFQRNVGERLSDKTPEPTWRVLGKVVAAAAELFRLAVCHPEDRNRRITEIGKIVIHLAEYCHKENINLEYSVSSTWWEMQHQKETAE